MTPTQSNEELKPCPFCGGEVLYINPNEGGGQRVSMTYPRHPYCETCRQGFDFGTRSESKIIQKWNTRHSELELEVVKRVIKDEFLKEVYADMKGCEPNRHRMYQHEVVSWLNAAIEKSKQAQGGE